MGGGKARDGTGHGLQRRQIAWTQQIKQPVEVRYAVLLSKSGQQARRVAECATKMTCIFRVPCEKRVEKRERRVLSTTRLPESPLAEEGGLKNVDIPLHRVAG